MPKGIWVGNYFDYVYLVEGLKTRKCEDGHSIIGIMPSGAEVVLEFIEDENDVIAIFENLCERLNAVHPMDPRS